VERGRTLASRTDGSGAGAPGTSSFSYDWAGRLASAAPPSGQGGAVAQAWRLDGLLASRTLPSADPLAQAPLYDGARRPAGASLVSNPATSPSVVGSLGEARDRAGQVVSDSRSLPGSTASPGYTGTASYAYDGLGRLASESGLGARSYRYDPDGNRVLKADGSVTTSYAYDRSDQLASQTVDPSGTPVTTAFAWDAFGGMASEADGASDLTAYAYDALGRLASVAPPSGPAASL
jgi:YD repeat-containing protein